MTDLGRHTVAGSGRWVGARGLGHELLVRLVFRAVLVVVEDVQHGLTQELPVLGFWFYGLYLAHWFYVFAQYLVIL